MHHTVQSVIHSHLCMQGQVTCYAMPCTASAASNGLHSHSLDYIHSPSTSGP